MIEWYLGVNQLFREIRMKSFDALLELKKGEKASAIKIHDYINTDYERLTVSWTSHFELHELGNLGRHISFGMESDYEDIIRRDLPLIEQKADLHIREYFGGQPKKGFEHLLTTTILEKAYPQYVDGHLRDSVINSIIAVFDEIRKKVNLDLDGENLIGNVFSVANPKLILSELDTESGRNDQIGFMQIYQGAYRGIRNPKAHKLAHDLNEIKAAQYLVFASLLSRRIEEAKKV